MQRAAKETMRWIRTQIHPGMQLTKVREMCESHLLELGADSFWYWDVGAFVFAGEETVLSVSGREYRTSERIIGENDIITIDLSPQRDGVWGDYARTIVIEGGIVRQDVSQVRNDEWRAGLQMEDMLHAELMRFAVPDTTFEQLYFHMNGFISAHGYENLDFLGNLGHSIVRDKADRIYIEKGNLRMLGSVGAFTFEPHICRKDGRHGYKKENIYQFIGGRLIEW